MLISPLLIDQGTGGQKNFQNTTYHYGGRGGGVMAKSEHYVVYEGSLKWQNFLYMMENHTIIVLILLLPR